MERYRFNQHKTAFLASRILLKTCLAEYLSCALSDIRFTLNAYGKPELPPEINPHGVHFNLSHSGDYSVVALHTQPVGIDTEKLDRTTDMLKIAQHNFHPLEIAQLENQPANAPLGLYLWMLKEAYIKYIGKGLAHPLREFYFLLDQHRLHCGSEDKSASPGAALLKIAGGCVAAVCHAPAQLEWHAYSLQDQGVVRVAELEWLAQTAPVDKSTHIPLKAINAGPLL